MLLGVCDDISEGWSRPGQGQGLGPNEGCLLGLGICYTICSRGWGWG